MVNSNHITSLRPRKICRALATALFAAIVLAALPAGAQGTGAAGGSGAGSSGAGASGSAASSNSSDMARADSKMMHELAEANLAEIETGRLALEKSQNDQVKKFAQQMIDDHTAAQKELQTLAQNKGVKLPDGTDMKHKAMATAMRVLSGDTFDSQYIKRAGVNDHQQTIKLLQTAQTSARDPELKAMATKMLPKVRGHLKMAQEMTSSVGKDSGNSSSSGRNSGSSGSGMGGSGSR